MQGEERVSAGLRNIILADKIKSMVHGGCGWVALVTNLPRARSSERASEFGNRDGTISTCHFGNNLTFSRTNKLLVAVEVWHSWNLLNGNIAKMRSSELWVEV
jgi:hypothetical protein